MKKRFKRFFLLVLVTGFLAFSSLLGYPQDESDAVAKIDGVAVVLNGETLFTIQTKSGSFTPEERVKAITNRLEEIADDSSIDIAQLTVTEESESATSLVLGDRVIVTITEADAKAARETRQNLANEYREKIQSSIEQHRQARQPKNLLFGGIYTVICTLALIISFVVLNKTFPRIYRQLDAWRATHIPSLRIQNLELIPASQITDILIGLVKLIRLTIVLTILYIYIPLVLSFFPWTKPLGNNLFNYLFVAIETIWEGIVGYFPNIFIVVLIIIITYYILRFIKPIFTEIERGNLSFPGFYRDWARPTYKLVLFLIIALAAVVAFPYLPGSDSPAFQGVSLFLGVLFSLGSTSAVANVVGGIILIYTRAFQVGDRVKVGDAIGDIIEKTLLVTRIRTIKNVVITIPNSTVLSSNVINYSASARDNNTPPLILHTTITLGYDIPWRKVYQALISAANATEYILKEPTPFILQTSLDDFYVSYELNAYTNEPTMMAKIYSELHQNIQDKCNEVGIEILSPHYSAIRDGNQNTIPEDYLPKDYTAPGFRIRTLSNLLNLPPQQNSSNEEK